MIKSCHLSLTALAVFTAFTFPALADTAITTALTSKAQKIGLETITVTATRTERRIMDSPLSSTVITSEEIALNSAANLADLLRDVPGVEVADAATAGMKRIKIRGESSRRVAILIDGQELTDHSTYGAPLLLDPTMVERIEVIRGTGSVLYGQKALGGVINFITKKGGDTPLQANITTSYDSATKGKQYSASAYGAFGGFDYRLSWSDSKHDNREVPTGELDDTAFANDSIMAYTAYNFEDQTIGLTYDQYNMNSEIATGIPNFSLDMPQRDREKLATFYQIDHISEILKKIQIDGYQQTINRQFVQHMEVFDMQLRPPTTADMKVNTDIAEQLDTLGLNGQFDFTLNDSHYFIAGLQYTKDDVNKKTSNKNQMTLYMPEPKPVVIKVTEENHIEEASLTTKAIYFQDEWDINENWLVTLGARHYWVESDLVSSTRGLTSGKSNDNELVGSLATNYAITHDQNIRALISQGYGYPTLLQMAMGATAAGTYINPNPELEAEKSINYEIGYRFRDGNIVVDATAFYTDADKYLTTISCANEQYQCISPEKDDIYINADKAISKGVELDASIDFSQVNLYANATWSDRETTMNNFTTDKVGLPDVYGKIGIKFFGENDFLGHYWLDTYLRAASDAQEQDKNTNVVTHYAGWGTFNLAIGRNFGKDDTMMLTIECTNLADKPYTPASESLLAAGRSIHAKLSFEF
ncbi:TonB-dependent receptor plug domain-containing protein [Pseudoalteromonas denitrificans]|uniref:Hemoglobin/transferrin/lactoferrin receptor protein n=1 Tax=Pseudoalteromonas denitrificans DSM 6059 TaxID=1123010 RepID=A0A1I1K7I2_9GAMM|nr:TonB-dependent receptor [Pseudoalteromonas denitrificans]SFC56696.1 hemoglobin/transferrin/lactoferrin receptor protein [Pseudoalteromonas denitrificans DSM 6059]